MNDRLGAKRDHNAKTQPSPKPKIRDESNSQSAMAKKIAEITASHVANGVKLAR